MKAHIITLPGDGIGPEVMAAAEKVLDKVSSQFDHDLQIDERLMGGISIDQNGIALTDETLADCLKADAVLLGAVGGPKWDDPNAKVRPEQGLLALRKEMAKVSPDIVMEQEVTLQGGDTTEVIIPLAVEFFWPQAV